MMYFVLCRTYGRHFEHKHVCRIFSSVHVYITIPSSIVVVVAIMAVLNMYIISGGRAHAAGTGRGGLGLVRRNCRRAAREWGCIFIGVLNWGCIFTGANAQYGSWLKERSAGQMDEYRN
jgi:hypothetical protein